MSTDPQVGDAQDIIERHLPDMPDQEATRLARRIAWALDADRLIATEDQDPRIVAERAWDAGFKEGLGLHLNRAPNPHRKDRQ